MHLWKKQKFFINLYLRSNIVPVKLSNGQQVILGTFIYKSNDLLIFRIHKSGSYFRINIIDHMIIQYLIIAQAWQKRSDFEILLQFLEESSLQGFYLMRYFMITYDIVDIYNSNSSLTSIFRLLIFFFLSNFMEF